MDTQTCNIRLMSTASSTFEYKILPYAYPEMDALMAGDSMVILIID